MKKVLCLMLALVLVLGCFAGCGPKEEVKETKEIVMITDIGDIDDESFNQGTWNGVEKWAKANNKTYEYIKPTSSSAPDLSAAVDLAVSMGAKVIVTPGFVFEGPIYQAQSKYPNVNFVVLDSTVTKGDFVPAEAKNTASFTYSAEYSGFLAGYAAVQEGFTKLAYLGGIGYPTVNCFGFGFAQGAEYAAKELGIKEIKMDWGYTGNFADSPENTAKATAIFSTGAEVLFSVGGANSKSCFKAAPAGKWVITPDTDGTKLSEKVMTSALKELAKTVEVALDDLYKNEGKKYFGKTNNLSVADGMVGLAPFANSRYTKFTEAQYKAVYAKLVSGEIKVIGGTPDGEIEKTAAGIQKYAGLSLVKVNVI